MLPESEILIILIVKEVIGRVSQKKDTVGSVDRNSSRKPCTGRVLKGECPCAKGWSTRCVRACVRVCVCVCARYGVQRVLESYNRPKGQFKRPWRRGRNGGFRGTMGHSLEGLGPRLPELWVRVTRRGVPSIDLNPSRSSHCTRPCPPFPSIDPSRQIQIRGEEFNTRCCLNVRLDVDIERRSRSSD